MSMKRRLGISRGGQVSVPATIRKRWRTSTVTVEDRGDHVILRPAPDDPLEATAGVLAASGQTATEALARLDEEERAAEEGKLSRYERR